MKNKLNYIQSIGCAVVISLSAGAGAAEEMGAVNEPIKLAINEPTGQHITTRVYGEILSRMGYNVEYVTAGYYPQMTALRDDSITASLEIWSSNSGELMVETLNSGQVVTVGDLGIDPRETWHFNNAAKEACPGLPDWNALKECASLFAVAETYPNGRLLDYPVEWGTTNVDRIKALDLPFTSVPSGSEGSLIVEITSAEEKNEPLLVMFWSPHWLNAEVELYPVALPEYFDGCYDDAAAGVNPNAIYDCDWLKGHVDKVAWVGMEEKWPAAFALLREFQMTNDIQIPMMAAIDSNNEDLETVVKAWIDTNETVWQPWMDTALN